MDDGSSVEEKTAGRVLMGSECEQQAYEVFTRSEDGSTVECGGQVRWNRSSAGLALLSAITHTPVLFFHPICPVASGHPGAHPGWVTECHRASLTAISHERPMEEESCMHLAPQRRECLRHNWR